MFLNLSDSGLLIASAGKNGGVHLAREPKDITLWDIYESVELKDVNKIFNMYEGSDTCPVGKNFYQILHPHMVAASNGMKAEMEKVTLETLMSELKEMLKTSPLETCQAKSLKQQ
ncbi:MAG: Rrf2 family transcriptional regulator [Ruminococcus sp.]|nr:Rrf2 family transcriptional regulator [Ruminococcus sp.]